MKVRKLLILFVALSLSVTSCGKYTDDTDVTANDHENISVSEMENTSDQSAGNTCTLKEAWEIASEEVKLWSEDAQVVFITSTDNHDDTNIENGTDGKRKCWNFMFHSEQMESEYSIYVIEGKPEYGKEASFPYYECIDMDSILMDSDDIYEVALDAGMSGGVDWAYGFHYVLQYWYLNGSENEPQLVFLVRGLNGQGQEKMLLCDPYLGDVIYSTVKTGYDENGRSVWEEEFLDGETESDLSEQPEDEAADEEETVMDYANMTKEELERIFDIYGTCVQYHTDPQELADYLRESSTSEVFSPFSSVSIYEDEDEWKERMAAYYGEDWEVSTPQETSDKNSPGW